MGIRQHRSEQDPSEGMKRAVRPYDAAAKQLLACTPILAFVLKHTVAELSGCSVEEIAARLIDGEAGVDSVPVEPRALRSPLVLGQRNEDNSIEDGTVTYDVLVRVRLPDGDGSVGVVVNIEPQSYTTDYPILKRAVYYCARLLSAQRGQGRAGSDYGALEKVYSIWLLTNQDNRPDGRITTYSLQEHQTCGTGHHSRNEYDLIEAMLVELPPAGGYNGFLEKLATLFSLETSRNEKLRALEGELTWGRDEAEDIMGRLVSMGEYAVEYGMEKGVEQGLEQGLEQGREDATVSNLKALMTNLSLSSDQAMDALSIPAEDRKRYRELLTS